jgi:hypothetical protein
MKGNNTFVLIIYVAQPQCEFVEDYHKTSGYNIVVKIALDYNKMFIDTFVGLPTKSRALHKSTLYKNTQYSGLFEKRLV